MRKPRRVVFEHYGKKCVRCGEDDIRVLSIDHINNDGAQHRKKLDGKPLYPWLIKNEFPEGFQVLCRNCNWLKYKEHRELIEKTRPKKESPVTAPTIIRDLERGGCLRVLLLLKDGNTISARGFLEVVNYQTFQRARSQLVKLGLLEVTEEEGSQKQLHKLTPKGLDVAIRVVEIEDILS